MARLRKVTIKLHKDRYRVDWRDSNGVRHRPKFDTMAEAEAKRNEVLSSFRGEKPKAMSPVVVQTGIKESIKQYIKVTTVDRVGQTARNEKYYFEELWVFLWNEIKIEFVHEIEQIHFELFRAQQRERGLKNSSIKRKENTYRAWLNKCLAWGLIAKNPMQRLSTLDEGKPDIKLWSDEKTSEAIRTTPRWLKRTLFFLERTGRRPIDACRATFGDVDEVKKTIRVRSFKGQKTREIFCPLTDDCLEMIVNIRLEAKREFRGKNEDLIFLNSKKKPVTTNAIGLALRKLGHRNVYGLRHAFVNGLVDDGVHERDIQLLAGHAKFEMTTRYTHRRTEHLRDIAEKRAKKVPIKMSV